jgi:hypothetical protein
MTAEGAPLRVIAGRHERGVANCDAAWGQEMQRRTIELGILGMVVLLVASCQRKSWQADQVSTALIELPPRAMSLQRGPVGAGQWQKEATYVLADARNTGREDLEVTLAGELVDAQGAVVGQLRRESLRIPAGGVRTFALVDSEQTLRPRAASARLQVLGAVRPGYPAPVEVTDGHVFRDGDRVVVTGKVVNTAGRKVTVGVIAGFYDRAGVPIRRPFSVLQIDGKAAHNTRFVGPPGSEQAYLFVGQLSF